MAARKNTADPNTVFSLLGDASRQLLRGGLGAVGALDEIRGALLRGLTDGGAKTASGALRNMDEVARTLAEKVWSQLEELFELRATRLLNSLHIPTHRDVNELAGQVEKLSAEVARLRASLAEAERPAPNKTLRKTSTRKRSPGKKSARQTTRKKAAGTRRKTTAKKSAASSGNAE